MSRSRRRAGGGEGRESGASPGPYAPGTGVATGSGRACSARNRRATMHAVGNTFGTLFRVTTFGESHGGALGAVVDGCPSLLALSEADIQPDLDRRAPGQSTIVTQRKESDTVRILSGVFEGKTLGTPIG